MRKNSFKICGGVFILFTVFCSLLSIAPAASYPQKAINLVVGYPAGGATDLSARIMADALTKVLKHPVVVLNKPGGASAVGTAFVKNAKPDGYTLLYSGSGPILVQPQVHKMPYDSLNDFRFVSQVTIFHVALAVLPNSPYKDANDFINQLLKSKDNINIGMNGGPNMAWVGLIALLKNAKVDLKKLNFIVFDGDAPAIAALMGGHCQVIAANHSPMALQAEAGKLRILGVLSKERPKCDSKVHTFREYGYNVDIPSRYFIAAPQKTPDDVIQLLDSAIKNTLETESFQKSILNIFQDPVYLPSAELTEILKKEYKSYGEILKDISSKQMGK